MDRFNAWHRDCQVAHPDAVGSIFGHCPGPGHWGHGSEDRAAARIRCLQLQLLFERNLNETGVFPPLKFTKRWTQNGRPKLHQDGLLRPRTSSANCMSSAASMSDTAR